MNLLGATLVLVNSLYGEYHQVGVNAAWIAIGAFTLAKHAFPRKDTAIGPKLTLSTKACDAIVDGTRS